MVKSQKIFLALNIFISFGIGCFIYAFFKRGTYINSFFSLFGLSLYVSVPDNLFFSVLKNWLGDFLWAYALTFSMYTVLKKLKYGLACSAAAAFLTGAALEIAQKTGAISGTFDLVDIAAEGTAVILSIIIIKGVQKNEKV